MGGGDFEKIVRTGLCNKKKSRTDHKKRKKQGSSLLKQRKGRIKRLKEQEN